MIVETLTTVAKTVANEVSKASIEKVKACVEQLPDKIGDLSDVESLPEKIDLLPEDSLPITGSERADIPVLESDLEIAKTLDSISLKNIEKEVGQIQETRLPIQNKIDGLQREAEVLDELKEQYPEDEGYEILSEVYLRDSDGNIVKDPVTGEARRIDFVVVKDGKVVDSIEVTSKTADKTEQTAKEDRIRENGGNYVKDSEGNLVSIPDNVHTRIERRD